MKDVVQRSEYGVFLTSEFERATLEYMEDYKIASMFEELAEGLSYRDFERKFGRIPDFRNSEQDVRQFDAIREMWDSEFEKFGTSRLEV